MKEISSMDFPQHGEGFNYYGQALCIHIYYLFVVFNSVAKGSNLPTQRYLLSIDTALTVSSIMAALHRAIMVRHGVQIVEMVARTVEGELPHIQLLKGEINVGLLLSVRVHHVLLGVDVEPLEVDDEDRWKARYVQLLYGVTLLLAAGAVPAGNRLPVQVQLEAILWRYWRFRAFDYIHRKSVASIVIVQPINVPTAGAQAFLHIRRTGHNPPRVPTAANAAGTNRLTCLPKHEGKKFLVTHPMTDKCCLTSVIAHRSALTAGPSSSSFIVNVRYYCW
jgi:hypothetical protein